ncbi:hypothetical protein GGQ22_11655 [Nocardioides sp. zg-579]|uniref:Glycosyl-4,4'-diaponeurosporenoate acyltransferase n=1 Tax=Nocardioides marmotae TaxID=2663857 RepID=A0A6I3JCA0_9ACTN|nr:hypothetical protein [Nocardioides marmotae]MCR6032095.1 hypothetical protein [Gordonia jinghuaiqii]MTB95740.1 hypothetical protein [Nocardioides marmotae]QKE02896.1 hypothetical protein HPC71_18870 [Nocardioides marmotae]
MSRPPVSARVVLVASSTTALAAGGMAAAWVFLGRSGFPFALVTHLLLMAWVSSIVGPQVRMSDLDWFRVRHGEPRLYSALGVRLFGKLLDAIGWNRVIARERGFSGTREGLEELDQDTRRSEVGHGICLVVTAAVALGMLSTGAWHGAVWLVALGLLVHLYPALLQRLLRARVQTILARLSRTP